MARFRKALPQLGGELFLTDGGIETTLIFLDGLELPDFAAFHLLKRPEGEAALRAETDTCRRRRCPKPKRKRTTAGRSKHARRPPPTW
jgi:hypothetical protein